VSSGAGSTWSANAERYDTWFDQPWGRYASRVEREAILAAAGTLAGADVADIGCGTGRLTQHLEQLAANVVGLDPDPAMLSVASRRTKAPLIVGDGHSLPFGDASVDVAIAVTVCEFTVDPALVVSELARITRPGGRVIVGALNRHSPWGLANRNQFDHPPWAGARFLAAADLRRLGERHGTATIRPALYPPTALPLLERWGPVAEHVGRVVARRWGAFNVMTVILPKLRS
jgi:ubiquinone/menaquinone biosynthesis C-methylase UbiE